MMSARLPAAAVPRSPEFIADPVDDNSDDNAGLDLRWVTSADGTRLAEAVLALQGMYCAACAGVIEAALKAVPGVDAAEVNAASKRASVRWRPETSPATALIAAIERAGYTAFPAQHESAQAASRRDARQALWRLFVAGFCMMQVMMLTAPG